MPDIVLHDDLIGAVREVVASIDVTAVANAFVAALRPRRFEHWSALGSFAYANRLPEHAFEAMPHAPACRVCGAYFRLHAFPSDTFQAMRRTGAGRRDTLAYARYDLTAFARDARCEPDASDRATFDLAVSRIANVAGSGKTFAAEAALGHVFPSRADRKLFLGVLGVCGILASPLRPGFWPAFVNFEDRASLNAEPYTYPVTWWRRSFGIRRDALEAFGLDDFLSTETLRSL